MPWVLLANQSSGKVTIMREELDVMLGEYLQGQITLGECYAWISGVSWDDDLDNDPDLKTALGHLELLSIEFLEGLRPESEFELAAREFVGEVLWFDIDEGLSGAAPESAVISSTHEDIIAVPGPAPVGVGSSSTHEEVIAVPGPA